MINTVALEFDDNNNIVMAGLNENLQAKLTVVYSGVGLLEGRWLVAEPGSTEAQPIYRTLKLVRQNLNTKQRSFIESPELPTNRAGKYLLQFCVTNRLLDESRTEQHRLCPNEKLVAQAYYQVGGVEIDALPEVEANKN
ncbi:hypothetical protein [Oceanicoccus sp. KOV_DT_Chl]|uniref:hypothetical protein n=1 Tax=Oceanicoccus sp. KOV_DT_Chl TaxID=1904639 RepID=UPI0011AFA763|nr:hypothetical protein [Oceanicoccus sp. KOV_DT_Chl]